MHVGVARNLGNQEVIRGLSERREEGSRALGGAYEVNSAECV